MKAGWRDAPLELRDSVVSNKHTLFAMSDKRIYIKSRYAKKKRKYRNKPIKPFPNKWKRKLAKFENGSCYIIIICIEIVIIIIIIIIIITIIIIIIIIVIIIIIKTKIKNEIKLALLF